MRTIAKRALNILSNRRIAAIFFIIAGLGVTIFFGVRAWRAYQTLQFIREQGLDRGIASVDAIRPWMTIRYVSVAYGVPEEYIFAQLDIPFNRRNSNDTLGHLNRTYELGRSPEGEYPLIVDNIAVAILTYREDPVATGLDDIRPWMTIRYIANSTGVPESYLLEVINIKAEDDNLFKPLDQLAESIRFDGGPRALAEAIEAALSQYEGEP